MNNNHPVDSSEILSFYEIKIADLFALLKMALFLCELMKLISAVKCNEKLNKKKHTDPG